MSRILIVSERFWPEDFLVNDIALECKKRGDEVEVLTQVPSYPFDKIYDGYKNKHIQTTYYEGIPVHRVNTWFGYNKSAIRKMLNYIHFGYRTMFWALFHGKKYDKIFICHTAALTMASSAIIFKKIWKKPITIWTQDLWPDAVWGYGIRKTPMRERLLNAFVRYIYKHIDRICVSCPGYVQRLNCVINRPSEFIPQWEVDTPQDSTTIAHTREKGNKTIFLFAGNLGQPQNLENDIQGFIEAKLDNAELWLLGDGVMTPILKARYSNIPNVKLLGRRPKSEMPAWYAQADVMVISLTSEFSLTLPAKFQSYTKAGKPIFGIISGCVAELITTNSLGLVASPDSIPSISQGFRAMLSQDYALLSSNSKSCYARMFNRQELITKLL